MILPHVGNLLRLLSSSVGGGSEGWKERREKTHIGVFVLDLFLWPQHELSKEEGEEDEDRKRDSVKRNVRNYCLCFPFFFRSIRAAYPLNLAVSLRNRIVDIMGRGWRSDSFGAVCTFLFSWSANSGVAGQNWNRQTLTRFFFWGHFVNQTFKKCVGDVLRFRLF